MNNDEQASMDKTKEIISEMNKKDGTNCGVAAQVSNRIFFNNNPGPPYDFFEKVNPGEKYITITEYTEALGGKEITIPFLILKDFIENTAPGKDTKAEK